MSPMTRVSDAMTRDPLTVTPRADAAHALGMMRERKIRHLPVVDDDGELIGIVSERDLLRNALIDEEEQGIHSRIELFYTRDPETIEEDAPLADAARTLLDNKFGCLPVMKGHDLVGILTEADFVKSVLAELEG